MRFKELFGENSELDESSDISNNISKDMAKVQNANKLLEDALKIVTTLKKDYKDPKSQKYLRKSQELITKGSIELDNFNEYEFGEDY